MTNRRRFLSGVAGLVAWAKKPFRISPAASAGWPTCERSAVTIPDGAFRVDFVPRNPASQSLMGDAEVWIASMYPGREVHQVVGQSVYRVADKDGNLANHCCAFILSKTWREDREKWESLQKQPNPTRALRFVAAEHPPEYDFPQEAFVTVTI